MNPTYNPWITEQYNFQFLLYWEQMVKVKVKAEFTLEQATKAQRREYRCCSTL